MPPAATPPPHLQYARRPSRARGWLRRLRPLIIVLLAIVAVYMWGPPLWLRLQLAALYERCLSHQPATGKVIATINAGRITFPQRAPLLIPAEWERFYKLNSPPGFRSQGTAFLGEMRTSARQRVLVAVDLIASSAANDPIDLVVRQFSKTDWTGVPKQTLDLHFSFDFTDARSFSILEGRVDPSNSSHFSIPYQLNDGRSGTFDGWQREDGSIDLQRSATAGPTTR